jgi:NADH-quinone oxidoreductase subunit I
MPNPIRPVTEALIPIGKGLAVTLRHLVGMLGSRSKAKFTVEYPDERREQYPRTRWRHYLTRYENGLEKCIGCSLCAGACPARCIYVEAADNTDTERYSPGERYAKRYEINMLRCVFCGYCHEACPTGAIVLRKEFELADYDRKDFLYTKEMLLEPMPLRVKARRRANQPAEATQPEAV